MNWVVYLKDTNDNYLFPKAGYGPIPEGAILCIQTTKSVLSNSWLSTTGKPMAGTWKQYGPFARTGVYRMKITVPVGETWTIKFKTIAPMVEVGTGAGGYNYLCIGTCRTTGDNSTASAYYDSGIWRYRGSAGWGNIVAESIQTFTAGTYYFGVWAGRGSGYAQVRCGVNSGTDTSRPSRSSWMRGNSIIQIATLIKKD